MWESRSADNLSARIDFDRDHAGAGTARAAFLARFVGAIRSSIAGGVCLGRRRGTVCGAASAEYTLIGSSRSTKA